MHRKPKPCVVPQSSTNEDGTTISKYVRLRLSPSSWTDQYKTKAEISAGGVNNNHALNIAEDLLPEIRLIRVTMVDPNRLPDQWMVEDFRQGYPRFCALIDTHPALNIFRRFSKLRARIILRKQDTLSALEQQLETLDRQETTELYLATNRLDGNTERQTVLDDIEKAVKDYGSPVKPHLTDFFSYPLR